MTEMKSHHNLTRRDACLGMLLSAVSFSGYASALDESQTATSYFLLPADFSIDSLNVTPPPSDDLAEARLLLTMQRHRTAVQIAQIKEQAINPLPLFWRCSGLEEASHPNQVRKIQEAVVDTEHVVTVLKRRYNRPRPSVVLPDIQTVVPVPPYSAYPSGHATQSVVIATLMSEVAPDAAKRLQALATQIGRNREIAGLHYPSDTNAGFKLGRELSEIFRRS